MVFALRTAFVGTLTEAKFVLDLAKADLEVLRPHR